mgnify:CR=1 FL=1
MRRKTATNTRVAPSIIVQPSAIDALAPPMVLDAPWEAKIIPLSYPPIRDRAFFKPPSDVALPLAYAQTTDEWLAWIMPNAELQPNDLSGAFVYHWGLRRKSIGLRPACETPPLSLVVGNPPHVFVEFAGAHPEQYCQRCAALAEQMHWQQVDSGLLAE